MMVNVIIISAVLIAVIILIIVYGRDSYIPYMMLYFIAIILPLYGYQYMKEDKQYNLVSEKLNIDKQQFILVKEELTERNVYSVYTSKGDYMVLFNNDGNKIIKLIPQKSEKGE